MHLVKTEFPCIEDKPLKKAARRLRWFVEAFGTQLHDVSADLDICCRPDQAGLNSVFLAWIRNFEAQIPHNADERQYYITFASGLMLTELVRQMPLTVQQIPESADFSNPAYFWPEGYICVAFCLNLRAEVIYQEFGVRDCPANEFFDINTWHSFRENVHENTLLSGSFLELFAGEQPNWEFPNRFKPHHAMRNVERMRGTRARQLT